MDAKTGKLVLGVVAAAPLVWLLARQYQRAARKHAAAEAATATAAQKPGSLAVTIKTAAAAPDSKADAPAPAVATASSPASSVLSPASASAVAASAEPFDCYYFGYGSNMSSRTLKRRNIVPASSVPATLPGYRLAMNLRSSLAPLEPSFANVERDADPANVCHGVLHRVTRAHIAQLTREEGGGQSYLAEQCECVTYGGDRVQATVFVLPDARAHLKEERPCSKRYKGLLVHGARESKLDAAYVAKLEAMPEAPLPSLAEVLTADRQRQVAGRAVTLDQVRDKSAHVWTAVKGVVLDLSANTTFVATLFGGTDKTMDMAKFLCDSECPLPTTVADLNARHKAYIDAALATLMLTHPIVGHVEGQHFDW